MQVSERSIGMGWAMSERVIGRYRAEAGGIMKVEVGENRHEGWSGWPAHAPGAGERGIDRDPGTRDADRMDTNGDRS